MCCWGLGGCKPNRGCKPKQYGNFFVLCDEAVDILPISGLVLQNAKRLDVLGETVFHTANYFQMVLPLVALGTCKNISICSGNNQAAKVIANITA